MINRFFNALGWAIMIFAFIIFMISYANFPDEVLIYINAKGEPLQYIAKDSLFYILLSFVIIINAVFFTLNGLVSKMKNDYNLTQVGISATMIFFNMFFACSVYFINILNSRENFNYSNFGYLIYLTGGLMFIAIIFSLTTRYILKK